MIHEFKKNKQTNKQKKNKQTQAQKNVTRLVNKFPVGILVAKIRDPSFPSPPLWIQIAPIHAHKQPLVIFNTHEFCIFKSSFAFSMHTPPPKKM